MMTEPALEEASLEQAARAPESWCDHSSLSPTSGDVIAPFAPLSSRTRVKTERGTLTETRIQIRVIESARCFPGDNDKAFFSLFPEVMSASGLVSMLARTLAARYPPIRLKTDPPLSDEEHAENQQIEEAIHALPDHLKVILVEESASHYALWFYSTMFGLDNLGALTEELTEKLWYQVEFPEIPKRAVVSCESVSYTCIAIGPGLVVAGGGTIVGILESSGPVSGERGQKQGTFRTFDVASDENIKRASIVAISVVKDQVTYEHKRDGAVIAICWNDGHGSSYLYCRSKGLLVLIKQLRKNDYLDCPVKHMTPTFNSYGRVTYRGNGTVITFPVYQPFITAKTKDAVTYMRVNAYNCSAHRDGVFFTCDDGIAAWYHHPSKRVAIMYCPAAGSGSADFHGRYGNGAQDASGMTIELALGNASADVSSLHVTKHGTLFVGFTNGGILAFQIPFERDYGDMGYRDAWFKHRARRGAAAAMGEGLSYTDDCICNMDTGFDGAVEGIYSDAETGQRLVVVFSSGFMQVYDVVAAAAHDPEDMAGPTRQEEEQQQQQQQRDELDDDNLMVEVKPAADIALIPVRTIDLMVLNKVLDERQEKQGLRQPLDISRPDKRAKIDLAAIEDSAGALTHAVARHRRFAGSRKSVCLDARRIVYYNVDMQILSVWSFGPCI